MHYYKLVFIIMSKIYTELFQNKKKIKKKLFHKETQNVKTCRHQVLVVKTRVRMGHYNFDQIYVSP